MATLIFLTISIHIGPTRLLEVVFPNIKYDLEEKLHEGCTSTDWGNDDKIKEVMAANNNEDNNEKDP